MKKNYRHKAHKKGELQNKILLIIMHVFRYLLAATFIFSGFVKAIDPLGTAYKIEDYLISFNPSFIALFPIALPISIALSGFELIVGLNYLLNISTKKTSWWALVFMLVMTPLTLYIALFEPVSDCGCFGDALIISNWATFYKNLVISAFVVYVLVVCNKTKPFFVKKIERAFVILFAAIALAIPVHSLLNLPIIDFRPYKVGVNIYNDMQIPANAPTDQFETTFILEKNGVRKEFTLENYPAESEGWKFIDQKTVLIKKGFEPKIKDFMIIDSEFNDITDMALTNSGTTYLIVINNLNKTSLKGIAKIEAFYNKIKNTDTQFYALTAASADDVAKFKAENNITFPFYKLDPITLKTMVRANPGIVELKNGTITKKWNWRNFEK